MTKGLPPMDVAWWERDPHSCKRCVHSFYSAADPDLRYLRCSRGDYAIQCRYERHDTGECKPEALFWKERSV